MVSHEEAPPPYPGTANPSAPVTVTPKGDYKGVPVYEIGSNNAPVYNSTTYQPVPVIAESSRVHTGHSLRIGRHPVHCLCPQCHQQIVTYVNYESGVFAWLMCLLLTVVGCVPCCVIPFCVSSCQDATHICPHCSAVIGRHKVL